MAIQLGRLAVALLGLLSWPAEARVASIPGWSTSQSEKGVAMWTACGGGPDFVVYGIYPAYRPNTDNQTQWFVAQVALLTGGWTGATGRVLSRSDVAHQDRVMFQTIGFKDGSGATRTAVILGTFGALGQMYAIVAGDSMSDTDAKVQAPLAHAMGLIGQNFALDPRSLVQTPLRSPPPAEQAGGVLSVLTTSDLRYFTAHRITPQSKQLMLARKRFFEEAARDVGVQGNVQWVGGRDGAYHLSFGDGSIDVVPSTCAGPALLPQAAPSATARPTAPPRATAPNCRTVVKDEFTQRMETRCDWKGVCTSVPVSDVRQVEKTVCE